MVLLFFSSSVSIHFSPCIPKIALEFSSCVCFSLPLRLGCSPVFWAPREALTTSLGTGLDVRMSGPARECQARGGCITSLRCSCQFPCCGACPAPLVGGSRPRSTLGQSLRIPPVVGRRPNRRPMAHHEWLLPPLFVIRGRLALRVGLAAWQIANSTILRVRRSKFPSSPLFLSLIPPFGFVQMPLTPIYIICRRGGLSTKRNKEERTPLLLPPPLTAPPRPAPSPRPPLPPQWRPPP